MGQKEEKYFGAAVVPLTKEFPYKSAAMKE